MSTSSFKRKFAQVYNMSPKKHLTQKKLEKASQLLKTDVMRISDIAYDCGFETTTTFYRAFQKHYGQSPSQFRLS